MFDLASLGQQSNPFAGPMGAGDATTQNSALTPQSLIMSSLPSYLQTAGAIGNTSLSPLAMLLSSFGVGK